MSLLPAEISRPLERLGQRLHAMIKGSQAESQRGSDASGSAARPLVRAAYGGPTLDIEETDDAVIVRAELPGLQPTDFTIETTADRLILRGEKRVESEERGRGFYRVERRYGAFVRNVALPCRVERDRAEASYRDGVLKVTLPKAETAKARPIQIRVA